MSAIHGVNYGTPTLDLNFAKNKSLIDTVSGLNLITFSRSSTATYVGADGLIKTAASGEARFDHNPTTGESLGLLVEEARTNAALYSDLSSNNVISNATQGLNAATSPDGLFTASLITATSNSSNFYQATSVTSGSAYSYSIFVKAGTASYVEFAIINQIGFTDTRLTFGTGQISGQQSANLSVTAYSGGWFRVTWGFVSSATSTRGLSLRTADGTSYYAWGRQHEAGSFPTSYIPTTTATVTRAADVASMTGTNFSSWYRQGQGSFMATATRLNGLPVSQFTVLTTDGFRLPEFLFDSSGNGKIFNNLTGAYTSPTPLLTAKFGAAFDGAGISRFINGVGDSTASTSLVDSNTVLYLGNWLNNATLYRLSGTIARIAYYPTRLQDFQLQQLTK
jgi:hypothetical protein